MKSVRDIDEKMEQPSTAALEYVRIQKGRRFVYAVGNELYKRVKTEGNVKYLNEVLQDRLRRIGKDRWRRDVRWGT